MYLSMLAKYSLRTQIALLFGALVAATVVLVALGFGEWIQRDAQREAGRALQLIAGNAARTLADGLHERAVQTRVLADAEMVWRKGLGSPEVQNMLMRTQARQQHTAWVGMADTQGKVMAATGGLLVGQSVAARPWFQKGLEGPFVGDGRQALLLGSLLERPPGAEPARFVDFSAPVRVDGRLVGVVGMHGGWEWTGDVIESLIAPEAARAGLEVFVFDREGAPIYAPAKRMQALSQAGQRAPATNAAKGSPQVIDWLDGERALSANVQLPTHNSVSNLGWQVVARQPIAQAYARSTGVVRRALLVGLAAAGIAALLSWLLARRLSEDLQNLARAASNVNAGAHEAAIPLRGSSREVFELSSAMAHMTARMLQANDEMEEQVRLRTQQLERANQELDRQARTDALTGLLNRRGFEAQIGFALALAARNLQPLSVVTLDVDHFKRINDRYGHAVGDAVLQRLARLLPEHLRASDIVARVGGEEFVALLPSTDTAGAMKVAQALLDAVAAAADPDVGELTLSAGVASLRNLQDSRAALLQRSDEALYTAKQAGRNRVCMTP